MANRKNERARERYASDPEYRKKILASNAAVKTPTAHANKMLAKGLAPTPGTRTLIARTCKSCGDLVTVRRNKDGVVLGCPNCVYRRAKDYERRNPEKTRALASKSAKRVNAATLPAARNKGKIWTGAELERVANSELSNAELARQLGRTHHAVQTVRARLRIEPKLQKLAGISDG